MRYLWFNSRANQTMFDVACQMPALESLYIDWGAIADLSGLAELKQLKFCTSAALLLEAGFTDYELIWQKDSAE